MMKVAVMMIMKLKLMKKNSCSRRSTVAPGATAAEAADATGAPAADATVAGLAIGVVCCYPSVECSSCVHVVCNELEQG